MLASDGRQASPTGQRWLAAVAGLCAVLLGLSTNVASSLVPGDWAQRHAAWVWGTTALLALTAAGLAVLAVRRDGPPPPPSSEDHSTDVRENAGPVVIAQTGSTVTFASDAAKPAGARHEGQLVVGELPGAPPALVDRDAVKQLSAAFAEGAAIATVSALTGGRGAGKTQVAAQYARQAVADGVELVAWVSAADDITLLTDLAEVARRVGVADPQGDSETSACRLRDWLAARDEPAVLVFDNATEPDRIRRYLPATGATRVVITSTELAFATFGASIDVGVFDREQSLA